MRYKFKASWGVLMRYFSLVIMVFISLQLNASQINKSLPTLVEESEAQKKLPIIIRESPYSFTKTVINLKKAIVGKNYRIIRLQKLDEGFTKKGEESSDLIIYFCNFKLVNKALKIDSRVGQFLPCRITVIERNGKTFLMATNPRILGRLLYNARIKETCDKVLEMYTSILDEVTI